jgi:class 3 adenylate cyclase/tetratricopeptide (TPR) repeat protein
MKLQVGGSDAPTSAERKLATILFADLVASTELAASQDPERTRALLDRFYDAMAAEITAAGGTVEKFIGDAVMAVFGAPHALEDHAERAIHAALAMQRRLRELFGEVLTLRVGINTGEVVVGRARQGSSFVTGDAVNVAARLEQAAEPGEILAGQRTATAARGAFEFGRRTTVEAKGKPGGIACRAVRRALTLMRPRGVSGLARVFVGRAAELELLHQSYRRVLQEHTPYLVTVLGDAGVGKTRLLREFWQQLGDESPEPTRRTGRCLHYGQGISYWAIAEILKQHYRILDSDPPETLLEHLAGREILGLTVGLDVAGELHPLVARERLHEAWVAFVEELAMDRPTVILVEDLHWAEDDLLDLLERLLRAVRAPLLLVATARPELLHHRPGWGGARRAATTIELEPLSAEDAGLMLDRLVASGLPAQVRQLVIDPAEGNPFFVEELLGNYIDRGLLVRVDGRWVARELPAGFVLPDTVQAVVASRIDLLAADDKSALQAASVVGRAFWPGAIYELVGGAAPNFHVLEERDFIRRRTGSSMVGEPEFVFKHQLTREVAYASVPKARRARLHASFAAWLERFGAGRDDFVPLLAHHYAEAARPEDADLAWTGASNELERVQEQAIAWLRRAAEVAAGRCEINDALSLLERALTLEVDDHARIALYRQVAETYLLNYDMERYREAMERALALRPNREVTGEIYAELALYGRGRAYMWKDPPPIEVAERWIARALDLADPGSRAYGNTLVARALATPEHAASRDAATTALTIGEALDDPELVADGCEALALVASVEARFQEACEWAARGIELVPRLTDPGMRAHQFWGGAFVYMRGGGIVDVPPLIDEYERLARTLTPHDRMHAIAARAVFEAVAGRWQALADLTASAEAAAAANEDTPCQFNWRTLVMCALGHAYLGEEVTVRRLEDLAQTSAVVAGPLEREPALLRLTLLRGDRVETERILELLPATGDPWGVDAAAARLDALAAVGDRGRVEEEAAPYLGEDSYTRPFAVRALGLVRGDRTLIEQALTQFAAMGVEWRAEETRSLLEGSNGPNVVVKKVE